MAKRLRLLIIEDRDDDALLAVEQLCEWGFDPDYQRVDTAKELEVALRAGPWDAILADYNMPSFTGIDALRIVQSKGLDLPFLLVSGTVGEDRAVDAMKAGAHDYIMKGNLARLAPAIERELGEAQVRQERRQALEALQKAHDELEGCVRERTAELMNANRALRKEVLDHQRVKEKLRQTNEQLEQRVAERTAELREKDQMLLLQSRQAAMGEMIGNIAHQWRQPLNILGLTVQQLQMFYDLGEFDRAFLAENVDSSMKLINHMSRTIDDFRNYFKPDKDKVEFKVQDAIANTLSLLEGSFQDPPISVEVIPKGDPSIYGFPNEFAQVLLNLMVNAKDVITEREIVDPKLTITTSSEDGCTVVTVVDNAGGVPEEILGKIFEPYFSTKGERGTGVGLFMSKSIIEKNMGGRLTVRNTDDGAEFKIEVRNGIDKSHESIRLLTVDEVEATLVATF